MDWVRGSCFYWNQQLTSAITITRYLIRKFSCISVISISISESDTRNEWVDWENVVEYPPQCRRMSQTSVLLTPMIITRRRLKDPAGQGHQSPRRQSYHEVSHDGDCRRGSIEPIQTHSGSGLPPSPSPCPHHPPTPVFIYRNAHYVGFFHRLTQYLLTYNRVYVLQPLHTHFRQARVYLLEFLGFLILLFLAPFLSILAAGKSKSQARPGRVYSIIYSLEKAKRKYAGFGFIFG